MSLVATPFVNSMNYGFRANSFYFIVILEDDKFSKDVYDSIVKRLCEKERFNCRYFSVRTKGQYQRCFEKISKEVSKMNLWPSIHIECHSSVTGFKIPAMKSALPWSNLRAKLADVNLLCKNNLFVSIAGCFGAHLASEYITKGSLENQRAPFFASLAPNDEVSFDNLAIDFKVFFQSIMANRNIDTALEEMNTNSKSKALYMSMTCVGVFNATISSFLADLSKDFLSDDRMSKMVREMDTNAIVRGMKPPSLLNQELLPSVVLNKENTLEYLNEIRTHYFMGDLSPENQKRFGCYTDIEGWDELAGGYFEKRYEM